MTRKTIPPGPMVPGRLTSRPPLLPVLVAALAIPLAPACAESASNKDEAADLAAIIRTALPCLPDAWQWHGVPEAAGQGAGDPAARSWTDVSFTGESGAVLGGAGRLRMGSQAEGEPPGIDILMDRVTLSMPGASVSMTEARGTLTCHGASGGAAAGGSLAVKLAGDGLEALSDGGSHRLHAAHAGVSGISLDPERLARAWADSRREAGPAAAGAGLLSDMTASFSLPSGSAILLDGLEYRHGDETLATAERVAFLRERAGQDAQYGAMGLRLSPGLAGTPFAYQVIGRLDDRADPPKSTDMIGASLHGRLSGTREDFHMQSLLVLDDLGEARFRLDAPRDGTVHLSASIREDRIFERLFGDAEKRDGLARLIDMTGARVALSFLPVPATVREDPPAMASLRGSLEKIAAGLAGWIRRTGDIGIVMTSSRDRMKTALEGSGDRPAQSALGLLAASGIEIVTDGAGTLD